MTQTDKTTEDNPNQIGRRARLLAATTDRVETILAGAHIVILDLVDGCYGDPMAVGDRGEIARELIEISRELLIGMQGEFSKLTAELSSPIGVDAIVPKLTEPKPSRRRVAA